MKPLCALVALLAIAGTTSCGRDSAGPEGYFRVPLIEEHVDAPVWGLWGVDANPLLETVPNTGPLQSYVAAGIRQISLDGGALLRHSATRLNDAIAVAQAVEPSLRVVVPIPPQAFTQGIAYVTAVVDTLSNTTFFSLDEPLLPHYDPGGALHVISTEDVRALIEHVYREKSNDGAIPAGVYISTPEPSCHAGAYEGAYRLMPDYYTSPLPWKGHVFETLAGCSALTPLVALMTTAGDPCSRPSFLDLKAEISLAAPLCREVWFYRVLQDSARDGQPNSGFCDWHGIEGENKVALVDSIIRSYETPATFAIYRPTDLEVSVDASGFPAVGDYDGDGRADLGLKWDSGRYAVKFSSTDFQGWNLDCSDCGNAQAIATPADYDGDGRTDLSVYVTNDGRWLIDNSSHGPSPLWDVTVVTGRIGDVPAPGDYDGDGRADLLLKDANGAVRVNFAWNGYASGWDWTFSTLYAASLMPGDLNGDGTDEAIVSVFVSPTQVWFGRPQVDWYVLLPTTSIGQAVVADYDGDGRDDLSVLLSSGVWLVDVASDGFGAWDDGATWQVEPSYVGGVPVVGDFDGDGRADRSVLYASDGRWAINVTEPPGGFGTRLDSGYGILVR